jgi:hypothetical protein
MRLLFAGPRSALVMTKMSVDERNVVHEKMMHGSYDLFSTADL